MQPFVLLGVYLAASIPLWLGGVSFVVDGARKGIKRAFAGTPQPEVIAPRRPELVLVTD